MHPKIYIKRFSKLDRLFHLFLMLTFLMQTTTGFGRLFITTGWGERICGLFGGYEKAAWFHHWVGLLMVAGFIMHIIYLFVRIRIRWRNPLKFIIGPDSLVPNPDDLRQIRRRILWFFGMGSPPKFDRWTYWEKFDYWAVFWGLPLLAITGLMLIYPMWTSRFLPGWALNIASLLHKAEAILAASYIFIVHFFIGHLRPSSFPMNQAMFSGSVVIEDLAEEKPAWVERLKKEGKWEMAKAKPPARWYKIIYFIFGYSALVFGVYLLINGIVFSSEIRFH